MAAVDASWSPARSRRLPQVGSLGSIIFLLLATAGAFLALLPLRDNSFLTHLATGRLILERGSVPTTDPYSFTAAGAPWTVQSWLPSVVYAAAERAAGAFGVRLLVLVLFLIATALLWTITRSARSIVPRLLIAAGGMVVAAGTWSERPYMVGLIGLAMTWLALEGRIPGWSLVPFGWVWANSHGSFPLGVLLCLAVIGGTWLDRRAGDEPSNSGQIRVSVQLTAGLALGVLSPLGIDAMLFPLRAISDSASFHLIVEWQAPEFTSTYQRTFLVLFMLAIAAAVRAGRWRHVLPLLLFGTLSLLAVRNVVMAMPVVLAVLSAGAPAIGTLRSETVPRLGALATALMVVLFAAVVALGLSEPAFDLQPYPVAPLASVKEWPAPGRLLTQDFAGNLLEALDGDEAEVFIDDRADMYPKDVLEDYVTLQRAKPSWSGVLDQHNIGVVVWERSAPLSAVLAADPHWRIGFSDERWVVAYRRQLDQVNG